MKIELGCAAAALSLLFSGYVDAGAIKNKFCSEKKCEHEKALEAESEKSIAALSDSLSEAEKAASMVEPDHSKKTESENKKISGDPIVLKINDKIFKRSDVLADMKMIPPQMVQGISQDQLFAMVLEQKLRAFLIVEHAKSIGLESSKEYREELERLKESLLAKLVLIKKVAPKSESEAALKARYTKYLVEFKKSKEYHIFHIMLSTEAAAKTVLEALAKGEDFTKLAKEKSEAPSKENGGDEGFIPVNALPQQIKDKISSLKSGEYTKEFLKVENRYHIFKAAEIRDTSPQKFEEAKDMLKQMIMHEGMMSLLDELEKKSKIERFNEDGSPRKKEDNVLKPASENSKKSN